MTISSELLSSISQHLSFFSSREQTGLQHEGSRGQVYGLAGACYGTIEWFVLQQVFKDMIM